MNTLIRKTFLIVTLAALVLLALPAQSVYAAGPNDPPKPGGTPDPTLVNSRLEWAFARLKISVERIGLNREYSDEFTARIETLLSKAKANGKDVSAIEAALAAYQTALEKGQPLSEQSEKLVQTHSGFDANGKVTDPETAKQTVKALGDTLKQYRETVGEAAKALREAIKAFRQANPRPTRTPQP